MNVTQTPNGMIIARLNRLQLIDIFYIFLPNIPVVFCVCLIFFRVQNIGQKLLKID